MVDRNDSGAEVTRLWADYQNGLNYQASIGLSRKLPKFVKFYEGDQWPAPTKNTKNLPRPVINIIKMICRAKKSAILSTPVKIVYSAEDQQVDVAKFNDFSHYIQKEIGQEALDKKAVHDGVIKGPYIYHYYWDAEATGKRGVKVGGLRGEIIDPLRIFFSNPTEHDEQKQEWIIIESRESVKAVRLKCDKDVDPELIRSDEGKDKYGRVEQEGDELVTVLTRYFRKNGEVYCEKATEHVVVNKPFPITPDVDMAKRELGFTEEDPPNSSLPDRADNVESEIPDKRARATLYPIVVGSYEYRADSIYGLGEVEGLIPNQKAINFNVAMSLLNVQENAWGKYVVLPDALRNQVITNEPGQILVDYSKTGQGIRRMTEHGLQSQPMQLVESLTQLTRAVTGATEIMTGETFGANMSGAAIAQLQAQALQPVEELKESFWIVKTKQGKVLAQFFKLFYIDKEYSFADADNSTKTSVDTFDSAEYENADFAVTVEATAGTKASAAGDINILDVLYAKGAISLKTYINAYPKDAISNKSEILKGIEEDEQSQVFQLQMRLKQAEEQNLQLAQRVEKQQSTVGKIVSIINENKQLTEFISKIYTEARDKIREANGEIRRGNESLAETTSDAADMAGLIYGAMKAGKRSEEKIITQ